MTWSDLKWVLPPRSIYRAATCAKQRRNHLIYYVYFRLSKIWHKFKLNFITHIWLCKSVAKRRSERNKSSKQMDRTIHVPANPNAYQKTKVLLDTQEDFFKYARVSWEPTDISESRFMKAHSSGSCPKNLVEGAKGNISIGSL